MDKLYEEVEEPVSPTGQYLNNSIISSYVVAFMEFANPFDESLLIPFITNVFFHVNPRFSSIMVRGEDGTMRWRKVEVYPEEHIKIPKLPEIKESLYDNYFNEYVTSILNARTPQDKPLWEIHLFKYPTSKAATTAIFKLHHAIGDGYSLMSALLSCLNRADDPSLPLSFPSRQQSHSKYAQKSLFQKICLTTSYFFGSILDFGSSIIQTRIIEDDITPIRSGYEGTELQPFALSEILLSLDQIKATKSKLGVTINDLVTGIIFYGIRLYMEEKDEKTKCSNSKSVILLNTRNVSGYKSLKEMQKPKSEGGLWGNQFSMLQISIPKLTQSRISNPLEFVWESSKLIKKKRYSFGVYLMALLMDLERKLRGPEAVAKVIFKSAFNSSTLITNIIGPIEKTAVENNPVNGIYFTVMGGPENLFISLISYVDILRITLKTLKGFIDEQKLKLCIEKAAEVIFKAAMDISEIPTTN